jgi:hypothetical protein
VISEDEDSNLKVGVNSAVHARLSAVRCTDLLRPLPGLTNKEMSVPGNGNSVKTPVKDALHERPSSPSPVKEKISTGKRKVKEFNNVSWIFP